MNKCQLLMTEDGQHACLPVASLRGILKPCGQKGVKQVQPISGDPIIWVCAAHLDKLQRRETAVDLWNMPSKGEPN